MVLDYLTAPGWLSEDERHWLYKLAQDVVSGGWIVNIGIEYGASLVCLSQGCPTARLVGIDLIGDTKLQTSIEGLIVIKGDSTLIGKVWEQADLVFVDGGHDYKTVMLDAMEWGRTLNSGGRIAFHDTDNSPLQEDVNNAVTDWYKIHEHMYQELRKVDSIRTFERKYEF